MFALRPRTVARGALVAAGVLAFATSRVHAGPWLPPAGRLDVRATLAEESATRYFCCSETQPDGQAGTRVPFDPVTGGRWHSRAVFADIGVGVSSRLALGVSGSYRDAHFDTSGPTGARRTTRGVGDVYGRAQLAVSTWPVASAATIIVKAPTGRAPSDAALLPLGEGQWDVEMDVAVGRSFWPRPVYMFAESGFRYRTVSARVAPPRHLGDEVPLLLEAGSRVWRGLGVRVRCVGFASDAGWQDFGDVRLAIPRRAVFGLAPSAVWSWPSGAEAELTVATTLAGRNYPALTAVRLGLATALRPHHTAHASR